MHATTCQCPRRACWSALAGASAVLLGAFGAHALRGVLDARVAAIWHTAMDYQLWHALALALAVGLGRGRSGAGGDLLAFGWGIVLFSGSLYALALGAPRWVGLITPFGGLAFIVGWIALGCPLRDASPILQASSAVSCGGESMLRMNMQIAHVACPMPPGRSAILAVVAGPAAVSCPELVGISPGGSAGSRQEQPRTCSRWCIGGMPATTG